MDPWHDKSISFTSPAQKEAPVDPAHAARSYPSSPPSSPKGGAKKTVGILKNPKGGSSMAKKAQEVTSKLAGWISGDNKKEKDKKASSIAQAVIQKEQEKEAEATTENEIRTTRDSSTSTTKAKLSDEPDSPPKHVFTKAARKSVPKVPGTYPIQAKKSVPKSTETKGTAEKAPLKSARKAVPKEVPAKTTAPAKQDKPEKSPPKKASSSSPSSPKNASSSKTTRARSPQTTSRAKKPRVGKATTPMVGEGPPDEKIPGGFTWSEGWIRRMYQRQSGDTKDRVDKYWFPPGRDDHKLRSLKEVERYMKALQESPGDYDYAWTKRK